MSTYKSLPREWYLAPTARVARSLLGHFLLRRSAQGICGGVIVETEAYLRDDPACHAYLRETPRNRAMWGEEGNAYVYRIYGMHFCFNAVCQPRGAAEAVLVRAIEPTVGTGIMQRNRPVAKARDLTNGPAKLCAAMQIDLSLDGVDICDPASPLFIARNDDVSQTLKTLGPVITTTRIGITKAADWPLRFYLDGSRFVSRRAAKGVTPNPPTLDL